MAEGTSNPEVDVKRALIPKRSLRGHIANAISEIKGRFPPKRVNETTSPLAETNREIGPENEKPDLLDCDNWSRELEAIKRDNGGNYGDEPVMKAKNLMSRLFENKSILDESFRNGDFKDIESSIRILDRVLHSVLLSTKDNQMLGYARNIIRSGRDTVISNIENLDKFMEDAGVSPQSKKSVFQTVNSLFQRMMIVDQDKRIPINFKIKHFGKIAESMVEGQDGLSADNSFITDSMSSLLYRTSEDEMVFVQPFIEKLFADPNPKLRNIYYSNFFNALREGPRWDYSGDMIKGIIRGFLSDQIGEVNSEKMIENWRQAWPIKGYEEGEALGRNLLSLYELECERPGIGKVLFEQFGISDFARYPQELLVAQYDEGNKKDDLPYGIIINPINDNNGSDSGAFYGNVETFQKLHSQIKGRYRIRVWEIKNLVELVHAVNDSRHRYGPISFAIIGGHGTAETIQFGEEKSILKPALGFGILRKKDIDREGASAVRVAFTKNPTIILNSCTTGALGGIGQEISKMGAKVIAPSQPISIMNIEPSIGLSGKIDFRVEYRENSLSPQVYKEGILQK